MRAKALLLTLIVLLSLFSTTVTVMSFLPISRAVSSGMNVTGDGVPPDIPGVGIITGIGGTFHYRQVSDNQVAFTSRVLGHAEGRGLVLTYHWDFGDGERAHGDHKNPMHIYNSSVAFTKTYNVTLQICTDNGRCSSIIYEYVTLYHWTLIRIILAVIILSSTALTLYAMREKRKQNYI